MMMTKGVAIEDGQALEGLQRVRLPTSSITTAAAHGRPSEHDHRTTRFVGAALGHAGANRRRVRPDTKKIATSTRRAGDGGW